MARLDTPEARMLGAFVRLALLAVAGLGIATVSLVASTLMMPEFAPPRPEGYLHLAVVTLLCGASTLCVMLALKFVRG